MKHVASSLKYDGLMEDAERVLKTLIPVDKEIQAENATRYAMRILPYRTVSNVIDGIVITFTDVTRIKRAAEEVDDARERELKESERSRELAEAIVGTVRHPLVVLDEDLRVRFANSAFYKSFGASSKKTDGALLYELGEGEWNIPALRDLLERILPQEATVESFRVDHQFKSGKRSMLLNARTLKQGVSRDARILLAIEEVGNDK